MYASLGAGTRQVFQLVNVQAFIQVKVPCTSDYPFESALDVPDYGFLCQGCIEEPTGSTEQIFRQSHSV